MEPLPLISDKARLTSLWAVIEASRGMKAGCRVDHGIYFCSVSCVGSFIRRSLAYQLEPEPVQFRHRLSKTKKPGQLFKILRNRDQGRWSRYLAWLEQPELIKTAILVADQLLPFDQLTIQQILQHAATNKNQELSKAPKTRRRD